MPSVKSEPIHLNFEGMCTSCVYFSKLYLISKQMSLIRLKLSFKGKLEATHLGVKREETKTFCGWTKTTKIRTKTTKNYPKINHSRFYYQIFLKSYRQDKQHTQVQSHQYKIPSDGAVVGRCLGTPGQTKVSGDRQRENTHEKCVV